MEPDILESDTEKLEFKELFEFDIPEVDIPELELANLMEEFDFSGLQKKDIPVKDMKKWKEYCLGNQEDNETKIEHQCLKESKQDSFDSKTNELLPASVLSTRDSNPSHLVKDSLMYNTTPLAQKMPIQRSCNIWSSPCQTFQEKEQLIYNGISLGQVILKQGFLNGDISSGYAFPKKESQTHNSTQSVQAILTQDFWNNNATISTQEIARKNIWAYRDPKEERKKRKRAFMANNNKIDSDKTPDEILDQIIDLEDDYDVKPKHMEIKEILRYLKE